MFSRRTKTMAHLAIPPAPASISASQLAAMGDYYRARRGFASDVDLAEVIGVHRSRVADWKNGIAAPSPENARLLSHLAVVVTELESFLDPDVIPDWLATEQHALGGCTPVEALREGRLADVLYAANATEHGAYV
jgi:transcriptional regulator with XRE-family HTH domain